MARVSVIIPCFNRQSLLCETLDSLRVQSYQDWEAIIVDDCSQDDSFGVAQRYARQDARFRAALRRGDRKGANVCRNQGLSLATGEYVMFVDSDDLLMETCLENRIADMNNAPDCGFGVYQTELFTEHCGDWRVLWNAYTSTPDLHRFLSNDPVWHTTGPIWRREAVAKLGGFDENLLSLQDWDFHTRALIAGIRYFKKSKRDNFYRKGQDKRATISTVSGTSSSHLWSHERMFEKILTQLAAAGIMDKEIRSRVAGLFWWLAKRWQAIARIPEADRVWLRAHDLGLCSRRHYVQGRLIFRLYTIRGGGRLSSLIQLSWPPHFHRTGSRYFQNAPLDALAAAEEVVASMDSL